jgi:hypothetical protein
MNKASYALATAALAAVIAGTACDRRKPAANDAAQKELQRRQGDMMAEMDKIAAQHPPPAAERPADAPPAEAPPPASGSPPPPPETAPAETTPAEQPAPPEPPR